MTRDVGPKPPGPTHPTPTGPPRPSRNPTPARQDFSLAAVGPDEPVFPLVNMDDAFRESMSGSAMYLGGRWST